MTMYDPNNPIHGIKRMIDRAQPNDKMDAKVFSVLPSGTKILVSPSTGGRGLMEVLIDKGAKYTIGQIVSIARSPVSKKWTVSSTYTNTSANSNTNWTQANNQTQVPVLSTTSTLLNTALSIPASGSASFPGALGNFVFVSEVELSCSGYTNLSVSGFSITRNGVTLATSDDYDPALASASRIDVGGADSYGVNSGLLINGTFSNSGSSAVNLVVRIFGETQ